MAGDLTQQRRHWWPFPDLFEDFPFDLRPSSGDHMIRVEECVEDGTWVIRAELPGIDPDKDVEITVQDGVLRIKAERTEEKKDKHRSEFRYGSFERAVRLPGEAKEKEITASYDRGVLTVRAPLGTTDKQPHTVQITGGS
ncbi:hypothetical protein TR51_01770 [Kitasatospora griseola]|uniref:SHSP domain-containing protein n=1 Tax=Kitasatospora griseola TaxID=2064 RepID=A0A0D0Q5M7_KITGR|nr:Hsp20/alpha crystallin family protein [Kitasatospora griseola]KIQ66383.1 hypothetical protein TR51_01770 [Kitasatospora griseola]